jgi:hypothetical protein
MVVVFVGSNPSRSSPDSSPFHISVKSRKTLDAWIENINANFVFLNVSDQKTEDNKPLSIAMIKQSKDLLVSKLSQYPDAKIIALGKTASKALYFAGIKDFLTLPHPSGMNRQLNDARTVDNTKQSLIKYINGYNIITDAT